MTMIEKVARALAPTAWAALGTGDTLAQKNRRTASSRHASNAIEAIREPTDEMLAVGEAVTDFMLPDEAGNTPENRRRELKIAYQAMIDEALKGKL